MDRAGFEPGKVGSRVECSTTELGPKPLSALYISTFSSSYQIGGQFMGKQITLVQDQGVGEHQLASMESCLGVYDPSFNGKVISCRQYGPLNPQTGRNTLTIH